MEGIDGIIGGILNQEVSLSAVDDLTSGVVEDVGLEHQVVAVFRGTGPFKVGTLVGHIVDAAATAQRHAAVGDEVNFDIINIKLISIPAVLIVAIAQTEGNPHGVFRLEGGEGVGEELVHGRLSVVYVIIKHREERDKSGRISGVSHNTGLEGASCTSPRIADGVELHMQHGGVDSESRGGNEVDILGITNRHLQTLGAAVGIAGVIIDIGVSVGVALRTVNNGPASGYRV